MLWLTLISTPMMSVIQGMCARISMVKGEGIAALMRKQLPLALVYPLAGLVIVANTFNLGADIGGMAAATRLVVPIPVDALVFLFGIAMLVGQAWMPYAMIARVFKWLTLSLFAYVVTAFITHPPWLQVLEQFAVPRIHFNSLWLSTMVGVLGTTITPYLFYWQSSLMVEEDKEAGKATLAARRGTDPGSVRNMHADVNAGMIFSNLVAFFIIVTTASTLGRGGTARHRYSSTSRASAAPLGRSVCRGALCAGNGGNWSAGGAGARDVVGLCGRADLSFPRGFERAGAARSALLHDHCGGHTDRHRNESAARRRNQGVVLVGRSQRRRGRAVNSRHRLARFESKDHGGLGELGTCPGVGLGNVRADGRRDGRNVLLHGPRFVKGKPVRIVRLT